MTHGESIQAGRFLAEALLEAVLKSDSAEGRANPDSGDDTPQISTGAQAGNRPITTHAAILSLLVSSV